MSVRIIKTVSTYYAKCQKINDYVEMEKKSIDGQIKDVCTKIPSNDLCSECEKRYY